MSTYFNTALGRWVVTLPGGRSAYRYRLLMERHLGRRLRSDEHVHHLNGDRADDRLDNLVVLTAREHAILHIPERLAGARAARGEAWGPQGIQRCVECGTADQPHLALGECGRCYYRNRQRIVNGYGPRKPATTVTYVCEECGVGFERTLRESSGARFCGKSCASRAGAKRRWAERHAGREGAIGRRAA